jgi:hypothetical protein
MSGRLELNLRLQFDTEIPLGPGKADLLAAIWPVPYSAFLATL